MYGPDGKQKNLDGQLYTLAITQDTCPITNIDQAVVNVGSAASSLGRSDITADSGCNWAVSSTVSWLTINDIKALDSSNNEGASLGSTTLGHGHARIFWSVLVNGGGPRSTFLNVSKDQIKINQAAPSCLDFSTNINNGDVDGNGRVDIVDLVLLANFLAGNVSLDDTTYRLDNNGTPVPYKTQKRSADIASPTTPPTAPSVDISDLVKLANFLAGNTHCLP